MIIRLCMHSLNRLYKNIYTIYSRVLFWLMEIYQKIGNYIRNNLYDLNRENKKTSYFDSKKLPNITIENYVTRLYSFAYASDTSHIIALILLDRILTTQSLCPDLRNIHRLYALSLRIASKLIDDYHRCNYYYASVTGLGREEFNYLEHEFLIGLDWNLHICEECFNDMITTLEEH